MPSRRPEPEFDPSNPLQIARQERFAVLVSQGVAANEAYTKVYKTKGASAERASSRLLSFVSPYYGTVFMRVQWLKSQTATESVMDMKERRTRLARMARVNLNNFDLNKDGDLLEELEISEGKTKIKLASKRACIMDDAKLSGELIERSDITTDGAPLPSVAPVINLHVAPHWAKPRTE